MPDAELVREPEARALAVAVAGVMGRGGEHLIALGLGAGHGSHGQAAEEGEGGEILHLR